MDENVLKAEALDERDRLAENMPYWPETMKDALALPFVHSVTRPPEDVAGIVSINGVDRRSYELALSNRAGRLELDLEQTQKGERSADQEVERLQALLKDAEGLISTQMADINNLTRHLDAANALIRRQREEIETLNKRVVTLKEQRSRLSERATTSASQDASQLPYGLTWDDAPKWADALVRGQGGTGDWLVWVRESAMLSRSSKARGHDTASNRERNVSFSKGHCWSLIAKRPKDPSQDDYEPPIPLSEVLRAAAPRELAEALTIAIKRD